MYICTISITQKTILSDINSYPIIGDAYRFGKAIDEGDWGKAAFSAVKFGVSVYMTGVAVSATAWSTGGLHVSEMTTAQILTAIAQDYALNIGIEGGFWHLHASAEMGDLTDVNKQRINDKMNDHLRREIIEMRGTVNETGGFCLGVDEVIAPPTVMSAITTQITTQN